MHKKYQITLAAEFASLARFRDLIKEAARDHPQVDEQVTYDLQLAIDEACTNIITHGYKGMDPGSIILELEVEAGAVRMVLTDFGHEFEPASAPQPDLDAALEDREPGGFGLYFIYQTMDQVDYACGEDGNHLTLIKNLPQKHS